eukprot:2130690-Rhodomonas_salina.1
MVLPDSGGGEQEERGGGEEEAGLSPYCPSVYGAIAATASSTATRCPVLPTRCPVLPTRCPVLPTRRAVLTARMVLQGRSHAKEKKKKEGKEGLYRPTPYTQLQKPHNPSAICTRLAFFSFFLLSACYRTLSTSCAASTEREAMLVPDKGKGKGKEKGTTPLVSYAMPGTGIVCPMRRPVLA